MIYFDRLVSSVIFSEVNSNSDRSGAITKFPTFSATNFCKISFTSVTSSSNVSILFATFEYNCEVAEVIVFAEKSFDILSEILVVFCASCTT